MLKWMKPHCLFVFLDTFVAKQRYMTKKEDAFQTNSHYSLVGDRISKHDFDILCAFAKIKKGMDKSHVLKSLGISEQDYDQNVERVLINGF